MNEIITGTRRNGKSLEQMYQLVQYSKPPMKVAIWVAKIDDKLEQRAIMERNQYEQLENKAKAYDEISKIIDAWNEKLDVSDMECIRRICEVIDNGL